MPKLLLKFNAAVIKEIPLDAEAVTVGRKPDNTVVIDNPAISGHHCRISLQGGVYVIEDLDSTNGTFVNEKRIKKSGLHDNDVVGIAKHALVFLEDKKPEPAADKTMMITPEKQAELVAQSTAAAKSDAPPAKLGLLKILKGVVAQPEYELKAMSTYIGKSDRVQIPIKGAGLFGSAPEVACSVTRKPDGFYLMAVQEGYPVVNGQAVNGSLLLKDGDLIECGGTTMQFCLKDNPGAAAA
jgi:pSer/pThr/pTyr-binding forkhead associated (FHA) protein